MKYTEFNVNEKLFGKDYLIYDWQESDEAVHVFIKSQLRTGKCPCCGHESHSLHATYNRTIQTIPYNEKTTYAHVIAYKYNCDNSACNRKVFMENLPFAAPSQVRTIELNLIILAVSIFLSNEGASRVLGLIGIKVSNDAIQRLYDAIEIQDEPDIEHVGIDDIATRKGQHYATAIYDSVDHHLVALLDGRSADVLAEWLKDHEKIKLVVRDRANAYAKAINEILPDCIQVADRFHLLQNLIEKMGDIFKDELPKEIFIKDGEVINSVPKKFKKLRIPTDSAQLNEYDYDNSVPVDENSIPVHYNNKYHDPDSKDLKEQAKKRKKNSN